MDPNEKTDCCPLLAELQRLRMDNFVLKCLAGSLAVLAFALGVCGV